MASFPFLTDNGAPPKPAEPERARRELDMWRQKADARSAGEPELPLGQPAARTKGQLDAGAVVYMTEPLDRPGVLPGDHQGLQGPRPSHEDADALVATILATSQLAAHLPGNATSAISPGQGH